MQYRTLSELEKLEGNPRFIKDKEFQTLCDSIRDNPKYFEARPLILSDRTGKLIIIAGNQRYEAAKVLKLKEAPTFLMKGITEDKEREITIRDNAHQGAWDMDALANSWSDLPLTEWGMDLPDDWFLPQKEEGHGEIEDKELNINPESFKELAPTTKEMKQLNGKKIIVQFSGGKDSLTSALWVKNFFPENKFILLYCDLGSEFVTMQPFLYKTAELLESELVVVRSEVNVFDGFLAKKEWPFHGYPYCQRWL